MKIEVSLFSFIYTHKVFISEFSSDIMQFSNNIALGMISIIKCSFRMIIACFICDMHSCMQKSIVLYLLLFFFLLVIKDKKKRYG